MSPIHHVFLTNYLKETRNQEYFRLIPSAEAQEEPNNCFGMIYCISLLSFNFVLYLFSFFKLTIGCLLFCSSLGSHLRGSLCVQGTSAVSGNYWLINLVPRVLDTLVQRNGKRETRVSRTLGTRLLAYQIIVPCDMRTGGNFLFCVRELRYCLQHS